MKSKVLLFSILVFSLLAVNCVYATLTVTPSLTKSLTENEQVTVTVTVANSAGSSTESSLVTELSSSPAWFSVVSACSSIPSLSGGSSQTSTCIIKPTSTGGDLRLTATSTSQGGISGSGETSGINVASQSSSLTASISSASSVGTSATFYVGTTVVAPSANDVINARATISVSGQCDVDTANVPVQQSLGDITKGTTKSVTNWKISSSSASGTCSVTVNVVSDAGGSAVLSKSINVGTTTSAVGGTTGAAGAITGQSVLLTLTGKTILSKIGETKVIIKIPAITTDKESNVSVNATELAITEMKIKVINNVTNVEITATKIDARPREVVADAPGFVNQYFEVTKANISASDIEKVTFNFKVEKSWISANKIKESTVVLYRYNNANDQWQKLETVKINETDSVISYEAVSPGLSVFAISGERETEVPSPEEKPPGEKPTVLEVFTKSSWKIVLLIGLSIGIVAVIYFYKVRFQSPKSKSKIS